MSSADGNTVLLRARERSLRWLDLASTPVDAAWLTAFRVLYGLSMCVSMLRFISFDWVNESFVRPQFHFKYWGFGWVEALPERELYALFWVLAALAFAVAIGFCFRVCAALFVLGFTYLQLIDVTTYLNHYYLASLLGLLLMASPAHRLWSLDALLRPRLRASVIPAGWLYLFRFQVGVVYTFAGLAKAHGDWLIHAQPLRIWLGSRTDLPLVGPLFTYEWAPLAMSWAGFLFDSTIVLWLSWRRTRPLAYLVVIVFHALTSALFPIGMFPVIMVFCALVFFPPDWPRRLLARVQSVFQRAGLAARPALEVPQIQPSGPPVRFGRAAALVALTYCAVQLLLPLRFLAYGGNVRWHEQGMRFSWRVMVREKNGSITYYVRSVRSGRVWEVSPHRYLTRHQEREMSGQPDLILQLAHHIVRDFERRGYGPVEVRVEALVSLNGRAAALLVDPKVDLARVRDGIRRAEWVLSGPRTPPPHTRPI
ncbi:MAG TPA: HTTM domain-containing protein [Polyangiaceae bacterium]